MSCIYKIHVTYLLPCCASILFSSKNNLKLDEDVKKKAWKEHYECLLNVEFPWNPGDLTKENPVEGPRLANPDRDDHLG